MVKRKNSSLSFVQKLVLFKSDIVKNPFPFFLAVLCFIILISHTLYVLKTYAYPEWDEHKYLGAAINFLPVLKDIDIHFFSRMLQVQKEYLPSAPPLYPILIDIPLLLFGTFYTYKISLWINVIFYIATIVSIYELGKEFFSKRTSFFASFIFAFYGFPLFYLHFAYTETVGTGLTTLALCFLAKTKHFKNTKYVCLFALFSALAFLSRWTTPIFIVGSLLVILVQSIKNGSKADLKQVLKNLFLLALFFLIPLVFYYLPNKQEFIGYLQANAQFGASWMPSYLRNPFSGHSVIWYLSIIAQQTIFFYLLFLAGFFLSIIFWKKYSFLLFGFIIPFVVFTFISTFKDDRFILPLYPVIALLSAVVFDYLERKKWKNSLYILLVITLTLGSLNFLGASWGVGPLHVGGQSILLPLPFSHPRRVWIAPISWPPKSDEGKETTIIETILADWNTKKAPHVLFTFENSQVGGGVNRVVAYERIGILNTYNLDGIDNNDYYSFFKRINAADYILVKNNIIDKGITEGKSSDWDNFIRFVRIFNKVEEKKNILPPQFVVLKEIYIPADNSTLVIYKKDGKISSTDWQSFAQSFMNGSENDTVIQSALSKMTQ